jgi:hypothetical protein
MVAFAFAWDCCQDFGRRWAVDEKLLTAAAAAAAAAVVSDFFVSVCVVQVELWVVGRCLYLSLSLSLYLTAVDDDLNHLLRLGGAFLASWSLSSEE